jgi:UDP-N-acetylmuramate--alanine ligase
MGFESLHFLGISGSGMSPLAEAMFRLGIKVSGYDRDVSGYGNNLKKLGIFISPDPAYDFGRPDGVVISSAIALDHPQLALARSRGIKILHRSDILATLLNGRRSVAVAGTHGKTSTTGLIAHMLFRLNFDPLAVVGGKLLEFGSSLIFGNGICVAEADESDGSFLKYHPTLAVVTNIEADHMNYWKTEDLLKEGFRSFVKGSSSDFPLILGWDSPFVRDMAQDLNRDFLGFGLQLGCHIRAFHCQAHGTGSKFEVMVQKDRFSVQIPIPSHHNVLNARAALTVAHVLKAPMELAVQALETFKGVHRRFELVYTGENVSVFSDYAHNPGKIAAACSVLRDYFPDHRKVVIFEPHRYSRVEALYQGFIRAFSGVDLVLVAPIYSSGEEPIPGLGEAKLAGDIVAASGVNAIPISTPEQLILGATRQKGKKDVILFLSAGDIEGLMGPLLGTF